MPVPPQFLSRQATPLLFSSSASAAHHSGSVSFTMSEPRGLDRKRRRHSDSELQSPRHVAARFHRSELGRTSEELSPLPLSSAASDPLPACTTHPSSPQGHGGLGRGWPGHPLPPTASLPSFFNAQQDPPHPSSPPASLLPLSRAYPAAHHAAPRTLNLRTQSLHPLAQHSLSRLGLVSPAPLSLALLSSLSPRGSAWAASAPFAGRLSLERHLPPPSQSPLASGFLLNPHPSPHALGGAQFSGVHLPAVRLEGSQLHSSTQFPSDSFPRGDPHHHPFSPFLGTPPAAASPAGPFLPSPRHSQLSNLWHPSLHSLPDAPQGQETWAGFLHASLQPQVPPGSAAELQWTGPPGPFAVPLAPELGSRNAFPSSGGLGDGQAFEFHPPAQRQRHQATPSKGRSAVWAGAGAFAAAGQEQERQGALRGHPRLRSWRESLAPLHTTSLQLSTAQIPTGANARSSAQGVPTQKLRVQNQELQFPWMPRPTAVAAGTGPASEPSQRELTMAEQFEALAQAHRAHTSHWLSAPSAGAAAQGAALAAMCSQSAKELAQSMNIHVCDAQSACSSQISWGRQGTGQEASSAQAGQPDQSADGSVDSEEDGSAGEQPAGAKGQGDFLGGLNSEGQIVERSVGSAATPIEPLQELLHSSTFAAYLAASMSGPLESTHANLGAETLSRPQEGRDTNGPKISAKGEVPPGILDIDLNTMAEGEKPENHF